MRSAPFCPPPSSIVDPTSSRRFWPRLVQAPSLSATGTTRTAPRAADMLGSDNAFAHLRGHPAFDGVNRISRATAGSPGRYPRRRRRHPGNIRAERWLDTDISPPVIVNRLDNTGLQRCNSVCQGRSGVGVDHTTISLIGDAHRPRFGWRTVLDGGSLASATQAHPSEGRMASNAAFGCEVGFREHARERHFLRILSMCDSLESRGSAKRARCRRRGRAIPRRVRSTAPHPPLDRRRGTMGGDHRRSRPTRRPHPWWSAATDAGQVDAPAKPMSHLVDIHRRRRP